MFCSLFSHFVHYLSFLRQTVLLLELLFRSVTCHDHIVEFSGWSKREVKVVFVPRAVIKWNLRRIGVDLCSDTCCMFAGVFPPLCVLQWRPCSQSADLALRFEQAPHVQRLTDETGSTKKVSQKAILLLQTLTWDSSTMKPTFLFMSGQFLAFV